LVAAAVEVFAAHGDRENRARARLRHVRERMGDDAFLQLLSETFEAIQNNRDWPKVTLAEIEEGPSISVRLRFANGDVSPDAADSLASLIGEGYSVCLANFHEVIVFGTDLATLEAEIDSQESLREAAALKLTVVACPGKRWCRRGIVHTNPLADRIRREFSQRVPAGITICLSGCPNGCSHSAVADFGFTGRMATQDGRREEVFDFLVGGGMGHSRKQAEKVAEKLNEDQAVAQLARALDGSCMSGGA
jgi:sulfite reductase beta subunit-like hemoprotein